MQLNILQYKNLQCEFQNYLTGTIACCLIAVLRNTVASRADDGRTDEETAFSLAASPGPCLNVVVPRGNLRIGQPGGHTPTASTGWPAESNRLGFKFRRAYVVSVACEGMGGLVPSVHENRP